MTRSDDASHKHQKLKVVSNMTRTVNCIPITLIGPTIHRVVTETQRSNVFN